jgi:hypothetical protein
MSKLKGHCQWRIPLRMPPQQQDHIHHRYHEAEQAVSRVQPAPPLKDISEKGFTTQAGRIRMSHLGRSGLRSNRASTSRIAFLDSEIPFR